MTSYDDLAAEARRIHVIWTRTGALWDTMCFEEEAARRWPTSSQRYRYMTREHSARLVHARVWVEALGAAWLSASAAMHEVRS